MMELNDEVCTHDIYWLFFNAFVDQERGDVVVIIVFHRFGFGTKPRKVVGLLVRLPHLALDTKVELGES